MQKTHVFNIVVDTGMYDSATSTVVACFMDFEQCSRFMTDLQASVNAFVSEFCSHNPKSKLSCNIYGPGSGHPFQVVDVRDNDCWTSQNRTQGITALCKYLHQKYALLQLSEETNGFDGCLSFSVQLVPIVTW